MNSSEFCAGIVVGFVFAGLFGFTIKRIREAYGAMGQPARKPEAKVSTDKTAWTILGIALRGLFRFVIWLFVLGIVALVFIRIAFPSIG